MVGAGELHVEFAVPKGHALECGEDFEVVVRFWDEEEGFVGEDAGAGGYGARCEDALAFAWGRFDDVGANWVRGSWGVFVCGGGGLYGWRSGCILLQQWQLTLISGGEPEIDNGFGVEYFTCCEIDL